MTKPLPQTLKPHGIILDLEAKDVPPDKWTNGRNVYFKAGETWRVPGEAPFPSPPAPVTFANRFKYIHYVDLGVAQWWIGVSDAGVAITDGTDEFSITPIGWIPITNVKNIYTLGDVNTLPFVNHPEVGPFYWAGDPNVAMLALPGWPANWTTGVMRSHKEFLLAANIDTGTGILENQISWSTSAVPGDVPADWVPSPTNDAGDVTFSKPGGPILDMIDMRDQVFVMKSNFTGALQYIGGQYVFQKRDVFPEIGIFATGAAISYGGLVYMLTGKIELIRHDGNQPTNLSYGGYQDYIRKTINVEFPQSVFLYRDGDQGQVVLAYPAGTGAACTEGISVEGASGDMGIRDLPSVYSVAEGLTAIKPSTWDSDPAPWDSDETTWNENQTGYTPEHVVFGTATGMLEQGATVSAWTGGHAVDVVAFAQRTELDFGEAQRNKTLSGAWPNVTGRSGDVMTLRFGSQEEVGGAVAWEVAQTFDQATPGRLDFFHDGHLIAYSLESSGGGVWRAAGLNVKARLSGVVIDA